MPKQKSHKGLSKRVKITGSGKIKRKRSGSRHLLSNKNSKHRRRLASATLVKGKKAKTIKSLISK